MVSELWRVEVKYLVLMSALSLPVSLLLVFRGTICQVAVLLLLTSQNSLPGGNFMEVNTNKKKALREAMFVVYPDATPTQKETRNYLFTSFRGMYLWGRNGSILSRERILFLVSSTVYAHSFFMVPKSKADQTSIIFPLLPQSKQRKPPKIHLPLEIPAKRRNWNWKIKIPGRCCRGRSDFFGVDLLVPLRRKELTCLENACMKQEIADMKHEIADKKLEKAGMRLVINTLTFGLQWFTGSDVDIRFYTSFPRYSNSN